jgi:hypothetical protein
MTILAIVEIGLFPLLSSKPYCFVDFDVVFSLRVLATVVFEQFVSFFEIVGKVPLRSETGDVRPGQGSSARSRRVFEKDSMKRKRLPAQYLLYFME